MTDARIPERYLMDRRIVRLTHAQRSSYFMATLWSVSNRTDGHIEREDLPLIPTFDPSAVDALVERELWAVTATGWVDIDFETVQTSRDDLITLDNARKADREKKARQRAHKLGQHHLCTPDTCNESPGEVPGVAPSFKPVPGDIPGELSRGEHRLGEDRQGKDRQGRKNNPVPKEIHNSSSGRALSARDFLRTADESSEPVEVAPCCGSTHGPMDECPDQVRDAPKKLAPIDPGYCPPPCGRTFVNGACPRGHVVSGVSHA